MQTFNRREGQWRWILHCALANRGYSSLDLINQSQVEETLSPYITWSGQWWKGGFISDAHSFIFGSLGISSCGAGQHCIYLLFHHSSLWKMYITYLWGLIQCSLVKMAGWMGLYCVSQYSVRPTLRGNASDLPFALP